MVIILFIIPFILTFIVYIILIKNYLLCNNIEIELKKRNNLLRSSWQSRDADMFFTEGQKLIDNIKKYNWTNNKFNILNFIKILCMFITLSVIIISIILSILNDYVILQIIYYLLIILIIGAFIQYFNMDVSFLNEKIYYKVSTNEKYFVIKYKDNYFRSYGKRKIFEAWCSKNVFDTQCEFYWYKLPENYKKANDLEKTLILKSGNYSTDTGIRYDFDKESFNNEYRINNILVKYSNKYNSQRYYFKNNYYFTRNYLTKKIEVYNEDEFLKLFMQSPLHITHD